MVQFTPKSEAEIKQAEKENAERFLWDAGEYPFEVVTANDHTSAAGNESVRLNLKLFDDGRTQLIFDYITPEGGFAFKFRHAAYACGLGKDYESGKIEAHDFVGKTGIVKIGVQPAKGDYSAKNVIQDYVLDAAASVEYTQTKSAKAQASAPELNDDIGF